MDIEKYNEAHTLREKIRMAEDLSQALFLKKGDLSDLRFREYIDPKLADKWLEATNEYLEERRKEFEEL